MKPIGALEMEALRESHFGSAQSTNLSPRRLSCQFEFSVRAAPIGFLIFCSVSIDLLVCLVSNQVGLLDPFQPNDSRSRRRGFANKTCRRVPSEEPAKFARHVRLDPFHPAYGPSLESLSFWQGHRIPGTLQTTNSRAVRIFFLSASDDLRAHPFRSGIVAPNGAGNLERIEVRWCGNRCAREMAIQSSFLAAWVRSQWPMPFLA